MSADVRVKIEHYESEAPTVKHEVFFIMLRIARDTAEDALTRL